MNDRNAPVLCSVAAGKTHYVGRRHRRYRTNSYAELCGSLAWQPDWDYEITPKLATCRRCLSIARKHPELVLTMPADHSPRRWRIHARHGRRQPVVIAVIA